MGYTSLVRSPKKEEQQIPDAISPKLPDSNEVYANEEFSILDELHDVLDIEDEQKLPTQKTHSSGQLNWYFMEWKQLSTINGEEEDAEDDKGKEQLVKVTENRSKCFLGEQLIKRENVGLREVDDEKMMSLNLNLNYQDVMDAWSDRGSLWAEDYSLSMASNNAHYRGEVPILEEERTRREASVLRYKEKRQSRLFTKKIRYQVRKLNADRRPRIKGRFVKRL